MNEAASSESNLPYFKWLILFAVVALYSLGFNFYVPPNNGDDVIYYQGALSIAAGEGFKSQGTWIKDWPPIQSTIVAIAMLLTGSHEYYIAKIVNILAVFLSLLLAYRLMVNEQRQLPLISCLIIAVCPTSLLMGTGGQADFVFFALAMLFFLLLNRLASSQSWIDALLCGVVLGIASLTRWQGVLLGVGILFQAGRVAMRRDDGGSAGNSMAQLIFSATIGAAFFLGWMYWLRLCTAAGTAVTTSNFEYQGAKLWWQPAPLELGGEILNFFTQFENIVYQLLPDGEWLIYLATLLFLAILGFGFCLRIQRHGWRAADCYVMLTLAIYSIYAWKEARYAIPLAPFLLDYFLTAVLALVRNKNVFRVLFSCWLAGLLAIDGVLLFYGDGRFMGPRCQLMLKDERDFLRGYFPDLYDTCQEIKREFPDATIACDKFHTRIVRHYTQQKTYYPGYAPDLDFDLYVEVVDAKMPAGAGSTSQAELVRPASLEGRLSNPRTRGKVVLWRVD
jgi:4-amino-4-deoxy-L-arabinose transferase-like glycosyltransferase